MTVNLYGTIAKLINMETPFTNHLTTEDFESVYEPAEDTFLLMDALEQDLTWLKARCPALCVEVGSGSGVVASAICKSLGVFCLTSDINIKACQATTATAHNHGVLSQLDAVNGDLLEPFLPRLRGQVDLLFFNPPYVPTDPTDEPDSALAKAWAGGKKGREVMDRLFPCISSLLSPQGVFYLLLLKENQPDEVASLFRDQGFLCSIVLTRKAGRESLCILRMYRANPI